MVISTVFAGFGMIIYLQNLGNFPTYSAHTNVGMFCIAALLVGGASVEKASIGNLQRHLRIGFNRAARIMDQLYAAGVVSKDEGTKPRKVLMKAEEFEEYLQSR